jgi:predicted nucleic acid-binding protein
MIFMDSGALFSLVVPDDPDHAKIEDWRRHNKESLITTDYCFDELLTLLIARKRSAVAITTGWKIFSGELCRLHFLLPDQIQRAWVVFQAKHTLGWSFTDCTSKVLMDELGIKTAAAFDQHFRQFGGINVVP